MRRLLWILPLLFLATVALAADVGVFQRADCTTLTPATGKTYCFDETANALKLWNGTAWVSVVGGQALPAYTKAGLPAAGTAGRLARVTDDVRGVWRDSDSLWVPFARANILDFVTGGVGTSGNPWTGWETGLNALPANIEIEFPAGYYTQASDITGKRGWRILGHGMEATFITYTGAGVAWTFGDGAGETWRNRISSIAVGTTTGTHGIRLDDIVDAELDNVWVHGFSTVGLHLSGGTALLSIRVLNSTIEENGIGVLADGANSTINHVMIRNNRIRANITRNISVDRIIMNWIIDGNDLEAAGTNAIYIAGGHAIGIHENYMESVSTSAWFYIAATSQTNSVSITGNVFIGNAGTAIQLGTGTAEIYATAVSIFGNSLGGLNVGVDPVNAREAIFIGPNNQENITAYVATPGINSTGIYVFDSDGLRLRGGTAGGVYQAIFAGLGTVKVPALKYEEFTVSSAADVNGPAGTGLLFLVRNNTVGDSALVLYENALTPIIISQSGTMYVTGAPAAGEIQIKTKTGNLGVAFLAGATRNADVLRTTMIQADND